jgi:hypothetical protein
VDGDKVAVELTDFSVLYSQDSIKNAEETLKNKASKIVVQRGQILKVIKDKDGVVSREVLTKKWSDWIDYWAVDFNFESKREIIRRAVERSASASWLTGEGEEKCAGGSRGEERSACASRPTGEALGGSEVSRDAQA